MARNNKPFNGKLYIIMTLVFIIAGSLLVWAVDFARDFYENPQFLDPNDAIMDGTLLPIDKEGGKKGRMNILLAGTDLDGVHSDTIMIATYDMNKGKMDVVSIPRDTRVKIKGNYRKINAAHALGGTDLLIKTIKETFGIDINYFAKVNYKGFVEVVDILGGVQFDVPRIMKYDDPTQNLHIDLQPGPQLLNGKDAEGLVRWRKDNKGGGYLLGDEERIKVQQDFMMALIEQHLTISNLNKVGDLYGAMSEYVNTNFTVKDVLSIVPNLKSLDSANIVMHQLPGEGKYIGNVSYFLYFQEEAQTLLADTMEFKNVAVVPCNTK